MPVLLQAQMVFNPVLGTAGYTNAAVTLVQGVSRVQQQPCWALAKVV